MYRQDGRDGERELNGGDATLCFAAMSTRGLYYAENEDAFEAYLETRTFVVVDGTGGGRAAGSLAEVAARAFAPGAATTAPRGMDPLAAAVLQAATDLRIAGPEHRGGGVALAALRVDAQWLAYAHVGDARVYRVRDEALQRLTVDHSLWRELVLAGRPVEEVEAVRKDHPNIVTRALLAGSESDLPPIDLGYALRRDGDLVLLCTAGITAALDDESIREAFVPHRDDLAVAVARLVDAAARSGRHGNLTALAVAERSR